MTGYPQFRAAAPLGVNPRRAMGLVVDWSNPITRGLLACWYSPHRSGVGGTLFDLTGNGLHGTTSGTVTFDAPAAGDAVYCNGGYVDIGDPTLLQFSTGDFTLEAWLQLYVVPNGPSKNGGILTRTTDGAVQRYAVLSVVGLPSADAGKAQFATFDGTNNPYIRTAASIYDGNYHHTVGVRASGRLRMYLDGLQVNDIADTSGNLSGGNPQKWSIGREADTDYGMALNCRVVIARVWNRAISANEVGRLYDTPYEMLVSPYDWGPQRVGSGTPSRPRPQPIWF